MATQVLSTFPKASLRFAKPLSTSVAKAFGGPKAAVVQRPVTSRRWTGIVHDLSAVLARYCVGLFGKDAALEPGPCDGEKERPYNSYNPNGEEDDVSQRLQVFKLDQLASAVA